MFTTYVHYVVTLSIFGGSLSRAVNATTVSFSLVSTYFRIREIRPSITLY